MQIIHNISNFSSSNEVINECKKTPSSKFLEKNVGKSPVPDVKKKILSGPMVSK